MTIPSPSRSISFDSYSPSLSSQKPSLCHPPTLSVPNPRLASLQAPIHYTNSAWLGLSSRVAYARLICVICLGYVHNAVHLGHGPISNPHLSSSCTSQGWKARSCQADFVPFLTHTFATNHNVSRLGNKPRILKKMAPPPAIKNPPGLFFSIRFATIFVNLSVGIECSFA